MAQTDPLDEPLTTSVADADSFRYYPAYEGACWTRCARARRSSTTAAAHRMRC